MPRGTIARGVFIRTFLSLDHALAHFASALIPLSLDDIPHTRIGQGFVRAHALSRQFVIGSTIAALLRFERGTPAVVGGVDDDLAREVVLVRSGGFGAGL